MKYACARGSRQGGRPDNEDKVAIAERDNAILMVLGDGLGGHKGGAIASATLCQLAVQAFRAVRTPLIKDPQSFLALIAFHAHTALIQLGHSFQPRIEPRTTCVLCLVQEGCAYWAHIGDSRLYHFHNGTLISRTQDHTTVDHWRVRGVLTEEELQVHPEKNRLLGCLGGNQEPVISLSGETALREGDLLVLCSDGVWEALTNNEITKLLGHPLLDSGLSDLLLAAENHRQAAADNISAIALRWQDKSAPLHRRAGPPRTIDAKTLWEDGRKRVVANKLKHSE